MGQSWAISHIASGCRIGPGDKLQKDCKARRARLLSVLSDWTAKDMADLALAAGFPDAGAFGRKIRDVAY
jgi:hypothetical protein